MILVGEMIMMIRQNVEFGTDRKALLELLSDLELPDLLMLFDTLDNKTLERLEKTAMVILTERTFNTHKPESTL